MAAALRLLISIAAPLLVAVLSGIVTARGVQDWYPTLAKPPFNPPTWVFGPVWTVLYLLMGTAAFLVWQRGWRDEAVRIALAVFALQLLLNGLWSVLFFGIQSPVVAFSEIIVLWLMICTTVVLFWRIVPLAGMILVPYALWVSFAVLLNGSIWILNR